MAMIGVNARIFIYPNKQANMYTVLYILKLINVGNCIFPFFICQKWTVIQSIHISTNNIQPSIYVNAKLVFQCPKVLPTL